MSWGIYGPRPLYPSSPIKGDWYKGGGVPLDGGRGIWIPKKDEKLSTKQRKSAKSLHFAFYFCIFAFRKLEGQYNVWKQHSADDTYDRWQQKLQTPRVPRVRGTRYTLRKYVSQVSSVIHRFEEMVDFSSTFPSEIAVISSGNHGNFLRKSRQLLEEITATSWGNP